MKITLQNSDIGSKQKISVDKFKVESNALKYLIDAVRINNFKNLYSKLLDSGESASLLLTLLEYRCTGSPDLYEKLVEEFGASGLSNAKNCFVTTTVIVDEIQELISSATIVDVRWRLLIELTSYYLDVALLKTLYQEPFGKVNKVFKKLEQGKDKDAMVGVNFVLADMLQLWMPLDIQSSNKEQSSVEQKEVKSFMRALSTSSNLYFLREYVTEFVALVHFNKIANKKEALSLLSPLICLVGNAFYINILSEIEFNLETENKNSSLYDSLPRTYQSYFQRRIIDL